MVVSRTLANILIHNLPGVTMDDIEGVFMRVRINLNRLPADRISTLMNYLHVDPALSSNCATHLRAHLARLNHFVTGAHPLMITFCL